jgi:FkbM family methyltransferase
MDEKKQHYSQLGEEAFILGFFEKNPPRRKYFVDVGAFDGIIFSNTRALYELGWKGALIEPHPLPFENLKETYKGDRAMKLLQVAIGKQEVRGNMVELSHPPIRQYGDLMLSTLIENEKKRWPHLKNWYRMNVQLISLKAALAIGMMTPDFMSIDCEGMDVEVLESAEFVKGDPRLPMLVMIEHNENRNGALDSEDRLLSDLGYERVYMNPINAAWSLKPV